MHPATHRAAWLCAALAATGPAAAASGQIDSFEASATSVVAGSWVDFTASFSIETYATSWGGSNHVEPAPEEGFQYWDINWYGYDHETLVQVWLQAGDQSFGESPSLPAGALHTGTWQFSMWFPTAGSFEVALDGGWTAQYEYYSSTESAYRDCWYDDPDGGGPLSCSSWQYDYSDDGYTDWYDDAFAGRSLTINVTAVPEPQTWALWLAGGAGLLAARRRLNR